MNPNEVAESVGAPTTPFVPQRGTTSTLFRWYADEARLCVMAGDAHMDAATCDVGFSHALGHLGDRDLIVVFPFAGAEAASHRLPFLDVPAASWALTDAGVEPVTPKRPADVLAIYKGVRGGSHDITEVGVLVAPLLEWLQQQTELAADDRQSYRTWHYKGRQVLTLRATPQGEAELVAGVNYSKPMPGQEPLVVRLQNVIADDELSLVQAAVRRAVRDRDAGSDQANAEHLLQELLRVKWKPLGLRAAPLREVPVRRPVGYGYIDLLGAGTDGHIHVVETKLGPFDRLIIQGLDYWIWATANIDALSSSLDLPANPGVDIDYTVAEKKPGHGLIGSYTAAQAEALHGSIRWRFTTIRNWTGTTGPEITRLPLRTMPPGPKGRPAPRKAQPRWAVHLARHLADHATTDGLTLGGGVFWPNAHDGLEPAAATVYERLAADGLAHHMIGHVRSSQAFALNLFAPLDAAGRRALAKALGIDAVSVSEPSFEWSDADDDLHERTHASPHATQVDVRLDCVTAQGTTIPCLIEVKLSEADFNPCSASLSPHNDRLDVCASSGPFGNDTTACFQLRNHDREHRRTYDTALGPLTPLQVDSVGCWFRFGGNQIMRNAALARVLLARGAPRVVVALCAPAAHRAIWRRWSETTGRLKLEGITFAELAADTVAQHHPGSRRIAERYMLRPIPADGRSDGFGRGAGSASP